jgi:transposase-like protein
LTQIDDDERVEFEDCPCPHCGQTFQIIKMDVRFLGRYTCPHCGKDVEIREAMEQ